MPPYEQDIVTDSGPPPQVVQLVRLLAKQYAADFIAAAGDQRVEPEVRS